MFPIINLLILGLHAITKLEKFCKSIHCIKFPNKYHHCLCNMSCKYLLIELHIWVK